MLGFSLLLGMVFTAACGGSGDDGALQKGGGGNPAGAGGALPGSGGDAASGGATGGAGAGAGAGGATSMGGGLPGLAEACSAAQGTRLSSEGPCFKDCTYNGALEPFYDPNGDCSRLGYKCSSLQYCIPNVRCTTDQACETLGGPGWKCITTVGSPFINLCLLTCATDSDCPVSERPSPYRCLPVDTTPVCRF